MSADTSVTAANRDLIERFLAAMSAGDAAHATSFLDEAATWEVVDASGPGILSRTELAGAIEGFAGMCSKPLSLVATGITADGERVAVEANAHAELSSGIVYDTNVHFLFEVRDGQIHAAREYVDTGYAARVFAEHAAATAGAPAA